MIKCDCGFEMDYFTDKKIHLKYECPKCHFKHDFVAEIKKELKKLKNKIKEVQEL